MYRYIILHQKFDCDIYFREITFLEASYASSKGQKGSKIANLSKIHPEAANLHREIISPENFDTVTYLWQITKFHFFWGTLGVKCESNNEILPTLLKTSQKQKICTDRCYFFMRNSMLSLIYQIIQFLALFGHPRRKKRSKITHLSKQQ